MRYTVANQTCFSAFGADSDDVAHWKLQILRETSSVGVIVERHMKVAQTNQASAENEKQYEKKTTKYEGIAERVPRIRRAPVTDARAERLREEATERILARLKLFVLQPPPPPPLFLCSWSSSVRRKRSGSKNREPKRHTNPQTHKHFDTLRG